MDGDLAPPPLKIKLFGSMEVEVLGRPLPKLRSRSELWLLALLALQACRPVTRGYLAQSLWPFPDHAEDQAGYNLRRALTNLRRALGAAALRLQSVSPSSLTLDLTGCHVDASDFEACASSDDQALLERAIALYTGPLLLECTQFWAVERRLRFEQLLFRTLQNLVQRAELAGDINAAAAYMRRTAAVDPLHEPSQRSLMEFLARSGDLSGALLVYQELSRQLHRERSAFPDANTTALFHRLRTEMRSRSAPSLMHGAARSASPAIYRLPAALTTLIGRDEEISEIQGRLQSLRLMTLTGSGGVGKTRIAIALAERLAGEFSGGVAFVDLSSLTDSRQVGQTVAAALDVKEEQDKAIERTLAKRIGTRELLLVLDNCEHLIQPCAALTEALLQACRSLKIVATSRQSLGIPGEGLWRVVPLSLPDSDKIPSDSATALGDLERFAAIQLFVERAGQVDSAFQLTERNVLAVAKICLQLEGIPLGIELAAARVSALTVDQICDRLSDRFRLLGHAARGKLIRQQTLEATIKWSFDLLEERDSALLRALSAFAGGWTLQAAEAVAADLGIDRDDALDVLARLVDRSLVVHEQEGEQSRYRFLETVRQYSCQKWMSKEELAVAADRQLEVVLAIAREAEPHLQGLDQAAWFGCLQKEQDNVRAALDWSEKSPQRAETGLMLAASLWRFWHRRGNLTVGRQYLARALDQTRASGPTLLRSAALNGSGMLAFFQGEIAAARSQFNESLEIAMALGDDTLCAGALHSLGQMEWGQAQLAEARRYFGEALVLRRRGSRRDMVAVTLNYLGIIASDAGDHEAARAYFEENLAIGREVRDRQLIANALHGLAHMAFYSEDHIGARSYYTEELSLARSLQDRERIARTLHRLGCVEQALKEFPAARRLFEESLFAAQELAYRDLEAAVLQNLGTIACVQGDYDTAGSCFEQRLAISEERGDRPGISYTLDSFGALLVEQKRSAEAVVLFSAARALRECLGVPSPENRSAAPHLDTARRSLGEEQFAWAWSHGAAMSQEEAVAFARRIETQSVQKDERML